MKKPFRLGLAMLATVGAVAACSVAFEDQPTDEGIFQCESDDDCLDDQVCEPNEDGIDVCRSPKDDGGCVDEDGDGFGSSEDRSNCDACQNPGKDKYWFCDNSPDSDLTSCCAKDCNDQDPSIVPGYPEVCDGTKQNCTENDEPPACTGSNNDSCPLSNLSGDDNNKQQSNTTYECHNLDGDGRDEKVCVLQGNNTSGGEGTFCIEDEGLGKCQEGQWTEVPSQCKLD